MLLLHGADVECVANGCHINYNFDHDDRLLPFGSSRYLDGTLREQIKAWHCECEVALSECDRRWICGCDVHVRALFTTIILQFLRNLFDLCFTIADRVHLIVRVVECKFIVGS